MVDKNFNKDFNKVQHIFIIGVTVIIGTTKRRKITRIELE